MRDLPLVSILIATFNSEKLLPRTLEAINRQTYPRDKMEILIVDGGSKDKTVEIAKKYGCVVRLNEKTEPINAKLIGMKYATGKYLITLDHDEVIENENSIFLKVKALSEHKECKVALCSGYECPKNYSRLNQYISEFGDPFSLFMYNFSKGNKYLEKALKKNYYIEKETQDYIKISFENMKKQPIFELCCLGTMIDREYFLKIPGVCEKGSILVQLFYIMLQKGDKEIILIKNDPLVHYSVDSLKAYFPKLKWRICNNVHFHDMGQSGFNGRLEFQNSIKYKKFLFIPYTVSTVIPLIQSVYLASTRKNRIFLLHTIFCWYVLGQIGVQYILKWTNHSPQLTSYDGKKKV